MIADQEGGGSVASLPVLIQPTCYAVLRQLIYYLCCNGGYAKILMTAASRLYNTTMGWYVKCIYTAPNHKFDVYFTVPEASA